MITAHLTDAEIQLYIAEPKMTSDQLKTHIQGCANCQARAANYRLLFNGIHEEAKPQFDFDLSALILERLPEPKRAFPWGWILVLVFAVLLISLSAILLWPAIRIIIGSAPLVLIATALTAAAIILIFQGLEMIKSHQRQLSTILNAKIVQL